jgi:hypothetical protein
MTDYGSGSRLARAGAVVPLVAGSLLLLAACATPQPPTQTASAPEQDIASLPPSPEAIPEPPAEPPEPPPPVEMVPPPPPEPPPLPMPTDAPSLRAAYGTPAFIRREPDSELWRYDGMRCAAFFFLYPEGGTYRIRHAETSPRGRDEPADPDCLRSLIPPVGGAPSSGPML